MSPTKTHAFSMLLCAVAGASACSKTSTHAATGSSSTSSNVGTSSGSSGAGGASSTSTSAGGSGGASSSITSNGTSSGTSMGGAAASSSGGDAGGSSPTPLGYMVGVKCGLDTSCPGKVEGWLGRPVDVAGATITTTSYIASSTFVQPTGPTPLLECSFPLLSIFGESNKLDDMGAAASGAYDATYTQMAQALAKWGNPLLSVRIGWEFNGNWYPWSNGVGTNATYANYVAAFKRAAAIVKKYNPNVLIQWCIAWGQPASGTPSTWAPEVMEYWPGAYDATKNPGGVDVLSMDFYQANISMYYTSGSTSTWQMAQSDTSFTTINLDWMTMVAQQQGVKLALSEYGAGAPSSKGANTGAGLDDGAWTAASIAWINGLPPGLFLWTAWSDDEPADDILTAGANPKEQAAWVSAWKDTRFGGSWWKGPAAY